MARTRRRLILAGAAALLASAALTAPASALRPLHVDALHMTADSTHVYVGEAFHLAIHARVREHVTALDELVVPDVGTMLLEGDERSVTASPDGTDVVETLTLEPTHAGTVTFSGAYLDAIDGRTGKPSRFSANAVRVVVEPSGAFSPTPDRFAVRVVQVVVGVAVVLALLVAAIATVPAIARRRAAPRSEPAPAAVARPAPPPPPPPPAKRDPLRDAVREALHEYRGMPTIAALVPLRAALFTAAGAPQGGTLRDALGATGDVTLRGALIAAERTAFGPASMRDAAAADLIGTTEAWLR